MSLISRELVANIQNEIDSSIKHILEKHNLRITKNNASISLTDVRITLDLNLMEISEDGKAMSKLALTYLKGQGIDPNREYTLGGKKFKIVDYVRRNHKRPVIIEDANGKRFKTSVISIIEAAK